MVVFNYYKKYYKILEVRKVKKTIIIFCAVLTFAMTLSGCGGNSNVKDTSSPSVVNSNSSELETELETDISEKTEPTKSNNAESNTSSSASSSNSSSNVSSSSTSSMSTIEEYIEAIRPQIESISDSFKDVFEISVSSEGDNAMIYQYAYKEQLEVPDAGIFEETMETTMKSSYSVFGSMLESLRDTLNINDPKLIVRYVNADDSILYEKELTLSVIEEYNSSKSE